MVWPWLKMGIIVTSVRSSYLGFTGKYTAQVCPKVQGDKSFNAGMIPQRATHRAVERFLQLYLLWNCGNGLQTIQWLQNAFGEWMLGLQRYEDGCHLPVYGMHLFRPGNAPLLAEGRKWARLEFARVHSNSTEENGVAFCSLSNLALLDTDRMNIKTFKNWGERYYACNLGCMWMVGHS